MSNNYNRGRTLASKGRPSKRTYKYQILRLRPTAKARRIEAEREVRDKNYQTLTPEESQVFSILRDFGREILELTGRGLVIDESHWAKIIVYALRKKP